MLPGRTAYKMVMITSHHQPSGPVWGTHQFREDRPTLAQARQREYLYFNPKAKSVPKPSMPVYDELFIAPTPTTSTDTLVPATLDTAISVSTHFETPSAAPVTEAYHKSDQSEEVPPAPASKKRRSSGLNVMIGFAVLMGTIMMAVGMLWIQIQSRTVDPQDQLLQIFTESEAYRVLLLPMQPYASDQAAFMHEKELQTWINAAPGATNIQMEAAFIESTHYPRTKEEAKRIGEVFEADIVLWGGANPLEDGMYHLQYASLQRMDDTTIAPAGIGHTAIHDVYALGEGEIAGTKDDIISQLMAIAHLNQEQYQAAYSNLKLVPTYDFSEMATVHHLIATCYQGMNNFEESLVAYDAAIAHTDHPENLLAHQASLLMHMAKPEEALASFDQALALNPLHLEALASRTALLHTGDFLAIDPTVELDDAFAMEINPQTKPVSYLAP